MSTRRNPKPIRPQQFKSHKSWIGKILLLEVFVNPHNSTTSLHPLDNSMVYIWTSPPPPPPPNIILSKQKTKFKAYIHHSCMMVSHWCDHTEEFVEKNKTQKVFFLFSKQLALLRLSPLTMHGVCLCMLQGVFTESEIKEWTPSSTLHISLM